MRMSKPLAAAAALALSLAVMPFSAPMAAMAAEAEAAEQQAEAGTEEAKEESADKEEKKEKKKEDKDSKKGKKEEGKEAAGDKEDVQAAEEAADSSTKAQEAAAPESPAPQKEGDAKGTMAEALKEEQSVLSDDAVYLVRIGYQFDDGSFDEWARGTALLAGPATGAKILVTRQGLADTAASSPLAARIRSEREEKYRRIGVYLSNDTETEAHMEVMAIDTKGNQAEIAAIKLKNGLALITLRTAPSASACVFAEKTSPAEIRGREVGIKAAGNLDDRNEVRTFKGEVIAPSDGGDGLFVSADMSGVSATGGILYDSSGHVAGMIAGEGDEKPCFTVNAIQTFMSTNGVTFRTAADIKARSDAIEKEDVADAIRESEASVPEADKKGLQESYDAAKKLRRGAYTKESYEPLAAALEQAGKCLDNGKATPAEVNAAKENLDGAVSALEEKSIPVSAGEAIPIAAGLAILVILISAIKAARGRAGSRGARRGRGGDGRASRKKAKGPAEEAGDASGPDDYCDDLDVDVTRRSKNRPGRVKAGDRPRGLTYADDMEESRVVELDRDSGEGTTLLESQAYLVRKDNGSKIPVGASRFVIGSEAGTVNFRIKGNTTVSRNHAMIITKEDAKTGKKKYYIEDLQSRNFTYVDGQQIPAETPVEITDGMMLRLSNVEMEFHEW